MQSQPRDGKAVGVFGKVRLRGLGVEVQQGVDKGGVSRGEYARNESGFSDLPGSASMRLPSVALAGEEESMTLLGNIHLARGLEGEPKRIGH